MSAQVCSSCQSSNQREFTAEVNIHFPGMKGLDKPSVWVFLGSSICLDCGVAQFDVPDAELDQLASERSEDQSYEATG